MTRPYAPPKHLSPDLARVKAYWEGLLRGSAEIPFWDDLDLTDLPDLAGRLFLIGVFNNPDRFRLDLVGEDLTTLVGTTVTGLFLDEFKPAAPFDFLASQASAAIEASAPTVMEGALADGRGYHRLVLPMWGDGRLSMLLGVVDLGRA
ncbi:MAG TPA: hypothetical protein PLF78_10290 [Caulobacter sp.]|mgnify:CR=1 FL=1|nr:hypothetical protein [Caulobacter sp.]